MKIKMVLIITITQTHTRTQTRTYTVRGLFKFLAIQKTQATNLRATMLHSACRPRCGHNLTKCCQSRVKFMQINKSKAR